MDKFTKNFNIRGRIQSKSQLRNYHKKTGQKGYVLTFVINDGHGQIQGAFFDYQAKKYNEIIQKGTVYSIEGALTKPSTKFNKADHKFEL